MNKGSVILKGLQTFNSHVLTEVVFDITKLTTAPKTCSIHLFGAVHSEFRAVVNDALTCMNGNKPIGGQCSK